MAPVFPIPYEFYAHEFYAYEIYAYASIFGKCVFVGAAGSYLRTFKDIYRNFKTFKDQISTIFGGTEPRISVSGREMEVGLDVKLRSI